MLGPLGGLHFPVRGGSCGILSEPEGETPRWVMICFFCFLALAVVSAVVALVAPVLISDGFTAKIVTYLFWSLAGTGGLGICIFGCCCVGDDDD